MLGRFCVMIIRFLGQVVLGTWIIDQPIVSLIFLVLASGTQSAFFIFPDWWQLYSHPIVVVLSGSEYFFNVLAASFDAVIFLPPVSSAVRG